MSFFEVIGMLTMGFIAALFIALVVFGIIASLGDYRVDKLKERLAKCQEEIDRLNANIADLTDDDEEEEEEEEADEEADG